MNDRVLLRRSLRHYWRTNAAVVLGVATAVAVLAGSLVVGESVRTSLARLALSRLGRTEAAVTSPRPFRQALAADVAALPSFRDAYAAAAAALVLKGAVSRPQGGRRSGDVQVYGVDEGFFRLHGRPVPPELSGRGALLSPGLAAELGVAAGEGLIVLLDATEEIPGSSLFGRRDEPGHRLRLVARGVLDRDHLGEFTLAPTSLEVRAVFVPLRTLQTALGLEGRANTVLVSAKPDRRSGHDLPAITAAAARLDDLGLRVRALPERGALSVESASAVLCDATVGAAHQVAAAQGMEARDALVYLANVIQGIDGSVPYSMVAGLPRTILERMAGAAAASKLSAEPGVVLNDWTARELDVALGESVAIEYYIWRESGHLETRNAPFRVVAIVPLAGEADDRDLVPEYPGITSSLHLSGWDPPFPVDLKRIRPQDESYWERHRTTPKAFVLLEDAQRLWGHRLGSVTSVRVVPPPGRDLAEAGASFEETLRAALLSGPAEERLALFGVTIAPVRERALAAARGTTDFGEYFLYFSFFLVVSALLLAGLFFRLGLEQRLRELGLLRAVGFPSGRLARQFLIEGAVLALAGAALGVLGAIGYARLIVLGLETVWAGALATPDLDVYVSARALAIGAAGGVLAALVTIALGIRDLRRRSPRALLSGALEEWVPPRGGRRFAAPALLAAVAAALLAAAAAGAATTTGAFFGAGVLLLAAALVASASLLRRRPAHAFALSSVGALGARAASYRPGRSLVCIALVAAAAFIIVAVGAFRRDAAADLRHPDSESGGFTLLATSTRPLHHDLGTPEGRSELGLSAGESLAGVTVARFRRSAGEDASCLNPYRPTRPTVLGAEETFLRAGRFAFQGIEAPSAEERKNPWLALERELPSGAVPVVADGTTLQYVLARKLGDEMALGDTGRRVRFVAALRPGLLQSELVTSERHFLRAFPEEDGFRFFLLDVPSGREAAVSEELESRLADFGFDVVEAGARLAAYHRVENTYIATFQTLGALGLLLGTVGLAAVLLRNAFERRRELALLTAVGYRTSHLRGLILGENALLLGLGLVAGLVPAVVAIAPALRERGGSVPALAIGGLVAALVVVGVGASLFAVAVVRRLPLLASLRSE